MVHVNGVEMPLAEMSGVLVLENPDGHQSWALIVDATIEYGDAVFTGHESPQMKVIATMKPGELLRTASTFEAGEENVLVYSRLLVALLREERDRYAEMEKGRHVWRQRAQELQERAEAAERDRDEMLHAAWSDGARGGYSGHRQGWTMADALRMNPHPEPEDDETDRCHVCGGPDH